MAVRCDCFPLCPLGLLVRRRQFMVCRDIPILLVSHRCVPIWRRNVVFSHGVDRPCGDLRKCGFICYVVCIVSIERDMAELKRCLALTWWCSWEPVNLNCGMMDFSKLKHAKNEVLDLGPFDALCLFLFPALWKFSLNSWTQHSNVCDLSALRCDCLFCRCFRYFLLRSRCTPTPSSRYGFISVSAIAMCFATTKPSNGAHVAIC